MTVCAAWHPSDYCTTGQALWWQPDRYQAGVYLCPRHHPDSLKEN